MKIIRLSFVIPTLIILALIIICTTLFLDNIIKNVLISTTQMATGAKVEIDNLKTSFKNCSVNIYGFRCADKDNEFQNMIDVDKIAVDIQFGPLLRKKIIVDNFSVTGLKTQTVRKTSGKLPKKLEKKYKKQSTQNSKVSKILEQAKTKTLKEVNQLPSVEAFNEIQSQLNNFDINKLIDKSNLESIKQIDTLSKELEAKYQNYLNTFNNLKLEDKIEDSKKIIDEISKSNVGNLEDVLKVANKVNELAKNKKYFDEVLNQLKSAQKDVTQTLDFSKQIKSSLNNDINSISSQLSIPSLNLKNISKILFGDKWVNTIEKIVYYINLIKKYMPEQTKEEKKIDTQQRQKGTDIIFTQKRYPTLLISKLNISGTTATAKNPQGIDFSGLIKNISSSPSMIKDPVSLDISGAKDKQSIIITGLFDHRTSKTKDQIKFNITGANGTILNIPQNDYLPLIDTATINIGAEFFMEDDDIKCSANILLKDIKEKDLTNLDSTLKLLAQLTNSIKTFTINANAKIVNDDMDINISSDIDKKLSNAISKLFSNKVSEAKKKVEKELNKIISEKTKDLESTLSDKKDELLKDIKENTNIIDDIEKEITKATKK